MMAENSNGGRLSYEDLYLQNQALRRQLDELKANRSSIWVMLMETNRRLQASSTSIKAAVSSLLDYNIFWDVANQHEFLQTINTSVDQAGSLVNLLSLALHLEAGSLELKRDFQDLQEILLDVLERRAQSFPSLALQVTLPHGGKPVLVDYEYLAIALEYLLEIFDRMSLKEIQVLAVQELNHWSLQFKGLDSRTAQITQEMTGCQVEIATAVQFLMPENVLRLHVACQLFHLQQVEVDVQSYPGGQPVLSLKFPVA